MSKYPHYHKPVAHLQSVDVYRVLDLFEVKDHALGHAIKKLLCAGQRGGEDFEQDVSEAVDTLNRRLQMIYEDRPAQSAPTPALAPGFKAHDGRPLPQYTPDQLMGWRKTAATVYPCTPLAAGYTFHDPHSTSPVPVNTLVDIQLRNGEFRAGETAGGLGWYCNNPKEPRAIIGWRYAQD